MLSTFSKLVHPARAARRYPPLALALLPLLLAGSPALGQGSIAYQNPFIDRPGEEWSPRPLAVSPTGQQFIGPFDNQTVTLRLDKLAEHDYMVIALDLYVIGDWPGLRGPNGLPSTFSVKIDNAPAKLHAAFASPSDDGEPRRQSYPDDLGGQRTYIPEYGSFQINSLGFQDPKTGNGIDATYRILLAFKHSGSTATIEFTGAGLPENAGKWGLDNIAIEVSPMMLWPDLALYGPTELEQYFSEFFRGSSHPGTNPLRPFTPFGGPGVSDDGGGDNPDPPPPPPPVPSPGTGLALLTLAGVPALRRRR
jgi:MYXO-CTERM domain-containing protein